VDITKRKSIFPSQPFGVSLPTSEPTSSVVVVVVVVAVALVLASPVTLEVEPDIAEVTAEPPVISAPEVVAAPLLPRVELPPASVVVPGEPLVDVLVVNATTCPLHAQQAMQRTSESRSCRDTRA